MPHQLIVLPDDTAKPLVDAINGAKRVLQVRMFLFTDTTLLDAVIAAHRRGVEVRVMLNPARRSGESENEESRKALAGAGVAVRDSNPAFDVTHQKSMVIDDEIGYVESLNWLQNERYQDTVIIERLVRAIERGVKVRVLARKPHSLKPDKLIEGVGGLRILQDVGAEVHTLKHLKLHGKMLLADGKRAIVGSINLAPGSFDSRRELAIETDHHHTVTRLEKIAAEDWENSHNLDLSDEGLLADLAKRGSEGVDKLVLDDGKRGKHHHAKH